MTLPFTREQFLGVFETYNTTFWPAQFVLYAVGLGMVVIALRPSATRTAAILAGLSLLWAWAGAVYHLGFFTAINPAARLFGGAFLLQAALWLVWPRVAGPVRFVPEPGIRRWIGALLLGYALVAYPVLNLALGHEFPRMPTFGLPCPTLIATFGLLCWASPGPPWWLWVVPIGWAAVGAAAAARLGMVEDLGLPAAALAAVLVQGWARARRPGWLPAPRGGSIPGHSISDDAGSTSLPPHARHP